MNGTPTERVQGARERVAFLCPEVAVGDVWKNVHGAPRATVTALVEIEEDASGAWPWPMVTFKTVEGIVKWGLPALIGCERARAGRGAKWCPPKPEVMVALPARARRAVQKEARAAARDATAALKAALANVKKGKKR